MNFNPMLLQIKELFHMLVKKYYVNDGFCSANI